MQAAIVVGQDGQGRVVAHRADRLLGVGDHRLQDQLDLLQAPAGQHLAPPQIVAREFDRLLRLRRDQLVQAADVLDPVAKGLRRRQRVAHLAVVQQTSFFEVNGDHFAWPNAAAFDNRRLVQPHHAGLRADDQQVVVSDRVTQRPQTVAVHAGDRPAAAEAADRGRTVPGLHHRVAVAEQITMRLRHRRPLFPGVRDHQRLDHWQLTGAAAHHHLEHRVQSRRIARALLDHRQDVVDMGAQNLRRHARFMGVHPVDVAAQRVDLAIVGKDAERLSQPPGRKGVGRIALMVDGEIGNKVLVEQIGIERGQLLGQEQALVDHRAAAERTDVEILDAFGRDLLLDPPAHDV